jgi:hypothetical protein
MGCAENDIYVWMFAGIMADRDLFVEVWERLLLDPSQYRIQGRKLNAPAKPGVYFGQLFTFRWRWFWRY